MDFKNRRVTEALSAAMIMTAALPIVSIAADYTEYRVVKGDNLWNLAIAFNTSVDNIASANNITNKDLIQVGQVLTIPTNTGSSTNYLYYYVQSGDTLSEIAKKYNLTTDQLAQWNDISDINLIQPGQLLKVSATSTGGSTGSGTGGNTSSGNLEAWQYQVVNGDNLYRIALRFGTTVDQLVAWNNIANAHWIEVGEVLQVAAKVSSQTNGATTPSTPDTNTGNTGSTGGSTSQDVVVPPSDTVVPPSDTVVPPSDTVVPEGDGGYTEPEGETSVMPSQNQYYVPVQCTVFDIAAMFNVLAMDLIHWNFIDDTMAIPAGTVINLVEPRNV